MTRWTWTAADLYLNEKKRNRKERKGYTESYRLPCYCYWIPYGLMGIDTELPGIWRHIVRLSQRRRASSVRTAEALNEC